METKLVIEIKSVYGNELIYPINELAKKFAQLVGRITLTRTDIARIKDMGFSIEQTTTSKI